MSLSEDHAAPADSAATPARRLPSPLRDGCHWLSASGVEYRDGGETEVAKILADASDLSALGDELAAHDDTWTSRYHFARERGHILRPLDLAPDLRVLEVGAGCGAVTRYLGETCEIVDALEPMAERAASARLRTRDLASVEVFVGDLANIPEEPAYDLVVIVGVLEYVGGSEGREERVAFLREARRRLLPGGSVVCAIENRLGVQYLAGAPEEHLASSFEGLEGYLRPGPARTYSRPELEELFREAELTPTVLGVMPDYKFARLVFSDALLDSQARPLAWTAPVFPSNASPHPRPRLTSELHLWRALVQAGLGGQFANSFLVIASPAADLSSHDPADLPTRCPDATPTGLWRDGSLATFYSMGRLGGLATESRLSGGEQGLWLNRSRLRGVAPEETGGLLHRPAAQRWAAGQPMLDALEGADAERTRSLLRAWRALVEADELVGGVRNVDLVPHNLVVDEAGRLTVVDCEWFDAGYEAQDVLDRGLLALAITLGGRTPAKRWPAGCETVRDLIAHLAGELGGPHPEERMSEVIERESLLLTRISGGDLDCQREAFAAALNVSLADGPLGRREPELHTAARESARLAQLRVEELERHAAGLTARVERGEEENRLLQKNNEDLSREREALQRDAEALRHDHEALARTHSTLSGSRSWRLTAPARALGAALRRRRS